MAQRSASTCLTINVLSSRLGALVWGRERRLPGGGERGERGSAERARG